MAIAIIAIDGYTCQMATTHLISIVRREIRVRRGKLRELSKRSGVPYSTLVKIGQGAVRNPRIETVEALLSVLGIVYATPLAPILKCVPHRKKAQRKVKLDNKPLAQVFDQNEQTESAL